MACIFSCINAMYHLDLFADVEPTLQTRNDFHLPVMNKSVFFFLGCIYLFMTHIKRERQKHRGRCRLLMVILIQNSTLGPWDHDPSQTQTLND